MLVGQRTNVVTADGNQCPLLAANLLDPCATGCPAGALWVIDRPATCGRTQAPGRQRVVTHMRVVVADDDLLLREGLASLLDRSGFEVVGQAGDAAELLALVDRKRPDLVIVDIRMPPTHTIEGLDAARRIRHKTPDTAILVLSAHVEVEHAMDLLASGE